MIPTLEAVGQVMEDHALDRYRMLAALSLHDLSQPHPRFCHVPVPFVAFLARNAEAAWDWLDGGLTGRNPQRRDHLLNLFIENTIASVYHHNPYVQLRPAARHALADLYVTFLEDFRDALPEGAQGDAARGRLRRALVRALIDHQHELGRYLEAVAGIRAGLNMADGDPVWSEYSPTFQLDVLRLNGALAQPVLDLGCGPRARLARQLHAQGIQTVGVDRAVTPAPDDTALIRADWLAFPLAGKQWGTVISHMAFSVHFLHHHLRADGQPEAYARRYMAILGALRPSGRFCYTPGLPFMETLLPPETYTVQRYPVPGAAGGTVDAALGVHFGESVLYTCHVTRRA